MVQQRRFSRLMRPNWLFSLLAVALYLSPLLAKADDSAEKERLTNAGNVLKELSNSQSGIPASILNKSECVIVLPSVKKGGFIIGGQYGKGTMADDDTWLDSFPVVRTDYPLPFDQGLQAKPAYWGIIDPTKLPGYGLTLALSSNASPSNTRILTVTATNGGTAGPAYATQLTGFVLKQNSGPSCTPKVTSSSFPILLGDIAPGASASASFTVSIVGCNPNSRFTLSVPWSASVYQTGTFVTNLDFNRGN